MKPDGGGGEGAIHISFLERCWVQHPNKQRTDDSKIYGPVDSFHSFKEF